MHGYDHKEAIWYTIGRTDEEVGLLHFSDQPDID